MSGYRHLIWDWNGTLLDDAWLCHQIINGLLRQRGLSAVTEERYQRIFGFPLEGYCRLLGFDLEREPYQVVSDAFNVEYEARRLECGLRQGTRGVLEAVRGRGVSQSVLSAYAQEALEEIVAHFGLRPFFGAVVGVDNGYGLGKVAAGLRRVAELGCAPGQVLLVGDTLHDLEVARAMGVDCALIPSGHQGRDRLAAGGARVVDAPADLLLLLDGPAASSQ